MQPGAVAIVDALGFKGIWRKHNPDDVIAQLKRASEKLHQTLVEPFSDPKKGPTLAVEFLSDTIVIGSPCTERYGPEPAATLRRIAVVTSALMRVSIKGVVPLTYRGCITAGDYTIDERFILGPAVDEAAAAHEAADAAIVWFSPRAMRAWTESKCENEGSLVEWDVPLKTGGIFHTYCVSPFQDDRASAESIAEAMLGAFDRDSDRIDVLIKKQNTARFLGACMNTHGWDWTVPS